MLARTSSLCRNTRFLSSEFIKPKPALFQLIPLQIGVNKHHRLNNCGGTMTMSTNAKIHILQKKKVDVVTNEEFDFVLGPMGLRSGVYVALFGTVMNVYLAATNPSFDPIEASYICGTGIVTSGGLGALGFLLDGIEYLTTKYTSRPIEDPKEPLNHK